MNWIARCPECGTTYKLSPDQLKMAHGWLRCGNCAHAFDSTGLVVRWPHALSDSTESGAALDFSDQRVDLDALLKHEDPGLTQANTNQAVSAFEDALLSFKPEPLLPALTPDLVHGTDDSAKGLQASLLPRNPGARWRSAASALAIALLFVGLVLQWLWLERVRVLTAWPAAGIAMNGLCLKLGCRVPLLQVRDGVVIESAQFTEQDGIFQLRWTLRNATLQALQTPDLELTLLNSQDQALVRRVVRVAESNSPPSLAPAAFWSGQLHLHLEAGLIPSGYRLVNFYP